MHTSGKLALAAIPMLVLAIASPVSSAAAAPSAMVQMGKGAQTDEAVVRVRRHRGVGTGAAIIGGIIVGAIIAEAIREGRATDSAMARCAAEFRSFDPRSGTYVTYGGQIRVCPYLR